MRIPTELISSVVLVAFVLSACEPSLDDHLDKLGLGGEAAEEAKNDLILAKELPVDALLTALVDPQRKAARPELVDILARVMMLSENPRIVPALIQRLRDDIDPQVRARVIDRLGTARGGEMLDDLFRALQDGDGGVRFQAVLALSQLRQHLTSAQDDTLRRRARRLANV